MHKHYSNIIHPACLLCLLAFLCVFITNVYLPLALWLLLLLLLLIVHVYIYHVYIMPTLLSLFFMQLQCILLGHATYIITTPIHMSFWSIFNPPPYSSLNFIFSHRKLDYNTNVLYLFPLPELIQQQQQWKPFVVKIDEQFTNIL